MVKINEMYAWLCPYCGREYDDEDDAEDCAKDCAIVEVLKPKQTDITYEYECEYCSDKFDSLKYAEECEKKHIEKEDYFYDEFKRKEFFNRPIPKEQKRIREYMEKDNVR